MTNTVQPILIQDRDRAPELWLCYMNEHGTWVALPGTGPIALPPRWQVALTDFKEQQK